MSNTYFQFKQFTVHQDRCAMKVSTDACIQGAWTPMHEPIATVLDLGTGTGLLSLMLAQRHGQIQIDAIELDEQTAIQARENFIESPWGERIYTIHADGRTYPFTRLYDMVICNPPFFNNSLLGDNYQRNNVRHTLSLSYEDVFQIIQRALKPDGYASVLLPSAEHEVWRRIVEGGGWFFSNMLHVSPKPGMPHNRVVSVCTPKNTESQTRELQIYNADNTHTAFFAELMKPFYLKG